MTQLYNLLFLLLSELNSLLLMFAVVLIATCFFGRSIVISKKFLFVGLGIVFLSSVIQRFEYPILKLVRPDVYAGLVQDSTNELWVRQFQQFEAIANTISSMVVFVYVFLFFLASYQEKKIRRAIESILCFWLVYLTSCIMNSCISRAVSGRLIWHIISGRDRYIRIMFG